MNKKDKINNKEYLKLRKLCKALAGSIQDCLSDDFKNYFESDISNWQSSLNKIKVQVKEVKK
jgi:hypothetical protein